MHFRHMYTNYFSDGSIAFKVPKRSKKVFLLDEGVGIDFESTGQVSFVNAHDWNRLYDRNHFKLESMLGWDRRMISDTVFS